MNPSPVLGIDFGTTNSVCAVIQDEEPEYLANRNGNYLTPSVVYYTKEQEQYQPLVGEAAENKAAQDPQRVIRSIKREMGDEEKITVVDETHRVEEVAADILREIRTNAAESLGVDRDKLTETVITTPAYWESDRKQAVIQAAKIAGFERVRTIKEPASAAIAYGRYQSSRDKLVGVYDLGGGTFDFALVDVTVPDGQSGGEYNVISQAGDPDLGGDDWDKKIVGWIVDGFKQRTGIDPREPHQSDGSDYDHIIRRERLRDEARKAKERLSDSLTDSVTIQLPFFMDIGGRHYDIERELSQSKFESLTQDLLERTKDPVYQALNDAGVSVHSIDDVILVGGSTRMPQVKQLVQSIFEQTPKDDVDPDKVVAAGAAVKGNRDDILLLEVTPLSLGIGLSGDRFKRMIPRNTRLPARETEVFTTSSTGATSVRIPIYQGEREIASENRQLKTLIIEGMTPGSRQSAHIEVTFEVQPNGLINVNAVESTRNKNVNVEIEGENKLSDEYVEEKIEEANEKEELDRKRKKIIDAQNEAKDAIKQAERLVQEFPHIIDDDELENIETHIANVRQIRHDDTATLGELREATDNLNQWVLEIGDRARQEGAQPKSLPKNNVDGDVDVDAHATESNPEQDDGTAVNELSNVATSDGNETKQPQQTTTQQQGQQESTDTQTSDVDDWAGVSSAEDSESNNTKSNDTASSSAQGQDTPDAPETRDDSETVTEVDSENVDEGVFDVFESDTGDTPASDNESTDDDASGVDGESNSAEKTSSDMADSEDTTDTTTNSDVSIDEVSTEREEDIVAEHFAETDGTVKEDSEDTGIQQESGTSTTTDSNTQSIEDTYKADADTKQNNDDELNSIEEQATADDELSAMQNQSGTNEDAETDTGDGEDSENKQSTMQSGSESTRKKNKTVGDSETENGGTDSADNTQDDRDDEKSSADEQESKKDGDDHEQASMDDLVDF